MTHLLLALACADAPPVLEAWTASGAWHVTVLEATVPMGMAPAHLRVEDAAGAPAPGLALEATGGMAGMAHDADPWAGVDLGDGRYDLAGTWTMRGRWTLDGRLGEVDPQDPFTVTLDVE